MKHLVLTTIAAVVLVGCGVPSPDDIYAAAYYGNTAAVKQHIAAGADINAKNGGGFTPLQAVAGEGHKEIAQLLIAEGADVNVKDKFFGYTALHDAAINGHNEIAELLIAKGADVNAKNDVGETPLDGADGEIADLLRKHGGKTGEELKAEGK